MTFYSHMSQYQRLVPRARDGKKELCAMEEEETKKAARREGGRNEEEEERRVSVLHDVKIES